MTTICSLETAEGQVGGTFRRAKMSTMFLKNQIKLKLENEGHFLKEVSQSQEMGSDKACIAKCKFTTPRASRNPWTRLKSAKLLLKKEREPVSKTVKTWLTTQPLKWEVGNKNLTSGLSTLIQITLTIKLRIRYTRFLISRCRKAL